MMGSPRNSLFSFFFFLVIAISFFSQTSNASEDGRVTVSVYYESLCPYCSRFISQDLPGIFSDGLIPIVNLRLVPWGNAALDSTGSFQCQHGAAECLLNTVEACTISAYPDVQVHYPFIQCVESLAYQHRESEWQACFTAASLDPRPIYDCYNYGYGRQIDLQFEQETAGLNPPHQFVPWVVVDGQPIGGDYKNFEAYICSAYRGNSVPNICRTAQPKVVTNEEDSDSNHEACYVGAPVNISSMAVSDKLP